MSQISLRCRHYNVNWINTHSCECLSCGKVGHWFENEGLVMWLQHARSDAERSEIVEPESGEQRDQVGVHIPVPAASSLKPAVA